MKLPPSRSLRASSEAWITARRRRASGVWTHEVCAQEEACAASASRDDERPVGEPARPRARPRVRRSARSSRAGADDVVLVLLRRPLAALRVHLAAEKPW
jgi:hypothetical protein